MKKLRIMIADEDPLSRSLLKSSLSYWGCDVVTAHNAGEAECVLQAGKVDVCILNWELSGFNAAAMCSWIRQADLKTKPYVIVLTEKGTRETVRAAYLAGANDFLTRPFRLEDMRSRISAIARKISRVNRLDRELGRMDPLECYRMGLAFYSKAETRP